MIEELLMDFGFPAFVTAILLYDKIRSNGNLKVAVENNTILLEKILKTLNRCN